MTKTKPVLDVHVKSVDFAKEAERKYRRRLMRLPVTYDGPVQPGQRWSRDGIPFEVKLLTPAGTVTLECGPYFWIVGVDELVRTGTLLTDSGDGVNLDTSNPNAPTSTPLSRNDSTEPPDSNSGSAES